MPISFDCPHCGAHTEVGDQYAGQTGPCAKCGEEITMPGTAIEPPPAPVTTRSSSTPIVIVLVVVGVAGVCVILPILIALLLPALQISRGAARRAQCSNNLKQIALAMHTYKEVHGSFPPAYIADEDGQPIHSWRVLILPFLDQQALYDQYDFDEPWDGPNNIRLAEMMPSTFGCPSGPGDETYTSYVVITGPGTMFDGDTPAVESDIKDGMSNTIMVVESSQSNLIWSEPDDLPFDQMSFQINDVSAMCISSDHPGGAQVALADASVHFLDEDMEGEVLRALITADGGELNEPIY